jgi:general secretion pathway protein E
MQDIGALGLSADDQDVYREMVDCSYGLILVTGPTGSGKTTTLYSTLTALATTEKNITSIEDPVEFVTDEFNQIAVQPAVDLTFITALRHVLRQDPDIIMVGEVRDEETARSAMRSALTGHLVLSTIHTNDTATTAIRLVDMGIEPYLIASTLVGVVAQRLMRTVCEGCAEEYRPSPAVLSALGIDPDESVTLRRGKGCRSCRGTGYKGRTGIFEVMRMSEPLRDALTGGASVDEVRKLARRQGMTTLRENARAKVLEGLTTPEEMVRVTAVNV